MALRFRIGYQHRDYTGDIAETGYTVVDVSSVQALDTFVLASEHIIQALSDAPIISALAYAKMPPVIEKPLTGTASIHNRLLCLFTNGHSYGSFVIPAIRPGLDYETSGPFAGIRVLKGDNLTASAIEILGASLAETILPDGTPFPFGDWLAARMEPK